MSSRYSWLLLAFILTLAFASQDNSLVLAASNSSNYTIPATLDLSVFGILSTVPVTITANYSYENGTIPGTDVCFTQDNTLVFNMSNGVYYQINSYVAGNYSVKVSCYKQGYENKTDEISFEIFSPIIDNDGDLYSPPLDCNDNNVNINPSKNEILNNNIDDDCDLSTLDYHFINITTNKENYALLETVSIIIKANNRSDTYVTINTPTNVSYVYIFANGSYPVTQQFSLTGITGVYSVDVVSYYDLNVKQATKEFTVGSPLNVVIVTNKNEAFVNEKIQFSTQITNAVGNVNMIWNMDDSSEKYSSSFEHSYSSPKTYNIVLIATDQGGNQVIKSKQVKIKPQYLFKVKVIDNKTSEIITSADVDLEGSSKSVNSSGMAEFKVTNASYNFEVTAPNYKDYDAKIKFNNSNLLTVKLEKDKTTERPVISLITENRSIFNEELRFKFTDNTKADCTLYVSEDSSWWTEEKVLTSLDSTVEYAFKPELDDMDYFWKVHCRDRDGNTGVSAVRKILKKSQVEDTQEISETFSQIQDIYDVIPNFDSYGPDEKKIVVYLDMEVQIKDAKRKLEMANRDIFNLRSESNTDSIIKKRDEIYSRIDQIKDETPLAIKVYDKANFVKYIDDEDLKILLEKYLSVKTDGKPTESLLASNKLLQKKVTIETTAYDVEIEYVSTRKQQVTLIVRSIDSQSTEGMYVEYIPKEIVQSTDDIVFIEIPTILEKDPLFEIPIENVKEFVYYIKGKVSLSEIPKIKVAVLSTVVKDENKITGFTFLENIGFSDSNKKIFLIQIVIVFILIAVYLYFSSDSTTYITLKEKGKNAVNDLKPISSSNVIETPIKENDLKTEKRKLGSKLYYIKELIEEAKKLKLKEAAVKYHEIRLLYDTLDESLKAEVFLEISGLLDDITLRNIRHKLNLGMHAIATENKEDAFKVYEEIGNEFEKLSEESKDKIYQGCCEFAMRLKDEA